MIPLDFLGSPSNVEFAIVALFGALVNNFIKLIKERNVPKEQRRIMLSDFLQLAWFVGTPVVAFVVIYLFSSPQFAGTLTDAFVCGFGIENMLSHGIPAMTTPTSSQID